MPIAPNQKPKIVREPLPGFKSSTKKTWDPPNKNSYTIESLAKELSIVSSSLLAVSATIADPLDSDDPEEGKKVRKASQEVLDLARRLESIYHRLMNFGIVSRQQDTMIAYRADDIPW